MQIHKIPNQIIKKPLIPLVLKNVDSIAFHHMAHKTWDVKDVEKCHVYTNGWSAIGYNYWIAFDGTVYEGRGFNKGAGVENHNSHIISIGLQGDFEVQIPTLEQYEAARELVYFLKEKIPGIKNIGCHKDWNATACPGKNFDIKKITEYNVMETEIKKLKEEIDSLKNDIKTLKEKNKEYAFVEALPEHYREEVDAALRCGIARGRSESELGMTESDVKASIYSLRAFRILKKLI